MLRDHQRIPPGYWLPNGLTRNTLPRPQALTECRTVLDVGAGLRPFEWYRPERHICIEPHEPYAQRIAAAGYEVHVMTARDALATFTADAVYLLDVIEHMEKQEALEVLELAVKAARRQVAIYTPYGFLEQDEDAWGLGGDYWQTHRSGWLPEDFPEGWTIEFFEPDGRREGIFALHG